MAGGDIVLKDVCKRFGSTTSVEQATLSVTPGEFITLLGPSGSGKTTLLNIIAGFVKPDSGQVLVSGRAITNEPPQRRGFGVVFQNYAIFPNMNVFDNVAFPLRMRRLGRKQVSEAVLNILAMVGMSGLEDRYVHQLSGGQQQRVAFARAVVFSPPVLLMDESLSALDRNMRQQLQHELRALQRRLGITVLFVTHDQEEALAMSDRIAVMNNGRIVQVGTGRELYEQPANEFVAGFFGESNVMEGVVESALSDTLIVSNKEFKVEINNNGDVRVGDRARIYLRPDDIKIGNEGINNYFAQVVDAQYLGETQRVTLHLQSGPKLVGRFSKYEIMPADRVVRVSWPAHAVKAFRI